MSSLNETNVLPEEPEVRTAVKQPKKKKKKKRGAFGRFIRRTLLLIFTLVLLAAAGLAMFLNTVFTGPSETARNELTLALLENPSTGWIPEVFLDEAVIAEIRGTNEG